MNIISTITDFIYYSIKGLRPYEKDFVEINSSFWDIEWSSTQEPNDKYIFVLKEAYPLILVGNIHISSMIAVERGLKILILVPFRLNRSMKKVIKSFGNVEIVYEDSAVLLLGRIISCYEALKTLLVCKTPEDVLSYESDGIRFGDLIYDSYLSCGYATMRKTLSFDLFKILRRFFYAKRLAAYILKNYDVEVLFATHMCVALVVR